ncbi:MAG TPA: MTH938/NDUFAF3 family protein [Streptosporangiaceae bacterium]|nr:MTH938/NDUFAF3 family protein [Streptosporangiaceae bacterium]
MRFTGYSFGSIRVDGVTYDHDLIIDHGKIRKRKKAASRKFRGEYGHTPLSAAEDIPWRCHRLVVGTGADGALPVMQQVRDEARRRKVDLVVLPTAEAIGVLAKASADTNAILHLTC